MEIEIEGTSEIFSVRQHLVEGRLLKIDDRYMMQDVQLEERVGDLWLEDVLDQYDGEEIRIVIVSLKDAAKMLALAKQMAGQGEANDREDGRDDRG